MWAEPGQEKGLPRASLGTPGRRPLQAFLVQDDGPAAAGRPLCVQPAARQGDPRAPVAVAILV